MIVAAEKTRTMMKKRKQQQQRKRRGKKMRRKKEEDAETNSNELQQKRKQQGIEELQRKDRTAVATRSLVASTLLHTAAGWKRVMEREEGWETAEEWRKEKRALLLLLLK